MKSIAKSNKFSVVLKSLILLFLITGSIDAWVYPEHREIALISIEKLSTFHRAILDRLWAEARKGYEFRLTESVIVPEQTVNPKYLDYASWPAIAGDHSCSSENMLHNILKTDWILKVAAVTAKLKIDLAFAKTRKDRINALRNSDLSLQDADPDYVTRAGSNNAHFLIALNNVSVDPKTYGYSCVTDSAELNAIGVYIWYHYSALLKAAKLATETLNNEDRSRLIISALADEAFALHFLEDVFAAGHVAGTWGDASQRKGTHDYYNEKGLKTSTWNGEQIVLTGDAWMREEDAERAAIVVSLSIEQLLEAANGNKDYFLFSKDEVSFVPDTFNVCRQNFMPDRYFDPNIVSLLTTTLMKTPVPGLATGLGELPRFRSELGLFVGFSPSLRGYILTRGFGVFQKTVGVSGGIEVTGRFGAGLDGVLNESGDGLIFIDVGWRQDGSSSTGVVNAQELLAYGNLFAAIPGRSAFSVRLRLPFYIIPGDLLIAAPFLFFIDKGALTKMGVTAVNGGLIPWQTGIATSFGRFQFVLGREIAVYLFGRTKERDALFNVSPDENGLLSVYILSYRSTQLEFPFLEYRPFRTYEISQRSSLFIQFYAGVDIPHNVSNLSGDVESGGFIPELENVWYLGARLIFDWRHYF